jgi:alpha-beta hydrolase superfamily lysophospholipase
MLSIRCQGTYTAKGQKESLVLIHGDGYNLNIWYLGYLMGGRIALDLALIYPNLVKSLVLANSSLGLKPASPEALKCRQITLDRLDKGDLKGFSEKITTSAFSPGFISGNPFEFKKLCRSSHKTRGMVFLG